MADLVAFGLQESIRHAAADHQPIDLHKYIAQKLDLIADLRPANNRRERPLGVGKRPSEERKLLLHQQPRNSRQMRRYAHRRRMRAMRRAERVVYVDIG